MFFGIRKKTALSMSLYMAVVTGLCCWGIVILMSGLARESIQQQQFAMTELIARSIDDKLGMNFSNITQVSAELPPEAFSDPEKAQSFLDSHADMRVVFDNGLFLFDRNLALIAESPYIEGRRGKKTERLAKFLRGLQKYGLPDVSAPYISPKTNAPSIVIAVPIEDANNELLGFLAGSITLTKDYFLEEIMNYKIGKKGYLYLFNTERNLILHPDQNRIMKHDLVPGVDRLLDRAIEGFEGSGETVNSRGIPQVVSYKRLRMADWILGAAYPQEEVYAKVRHLSYYLVAAAVSITLFSAFFITILTRKITANLNYFTSQVDYIRRDPDGQGIIKMDSSDEVALLAATFNGLMGELGLARESLDQMTRTDFLTGLNNRRHMEMEAPKLIALTERQQALTAFIMLDIDLFKAVNDSYGHESGDAVLVHIAKLLRLGVRPFDMLIRYGGEEFLLLLPLITIKDAMEIAERLRLTIQSHPATAGVETIAVTVSIGVYVANRIPDLNDAISRADGALYLAKNSGRNQVRLAQ